MANGKAKKKSNWFLVTLLSLLIVGTISYWGKYVIDAMDNGKNQVTLLNADLAEKDKKIDELQTKIDSIKDRDDVLKTDIELYIQTTHPKVPSIVAKAIAINAVDIGRKYKISPELIVGIIKVESSFNPMAVGPKTKYGHARGLMQVMPEWVKKLGLKSQYDFHEIDKGIESGVKVFVIHLKEGKGDISTGLYYYVNKDTDYVKNVYAAMGKFVAFRSTINNEKNLNVETDIDLNGDTKKVPYDGNGGKDDETKKSS